MDKFVESILSRLREIFDPEVLGGQFAQWLANLIVGLIVFTTFYIGWRVLRLILQSALQRSEADETSTSFLQTVLKYTLLTIGVVTALESAGIETSAVLASLGIVGLTIGFAARDALSNLISGILIFLDRPFVVGDLVEIEGSYGRVDRITLRSTRIVTSDGKMLAVPNTEVINKTVASYTNFPHLRLDVPITIGVHEDLERARRLLMELVEKDADFLDDPAPRVMATQLNDYNVVLELQAWIRDERQHVEKRSELRERAYNTLLKAGVEMPFQTLQLAPLQVEVVPR